MADDEVDVGVDGAAADVHHAGSLDQRLAFAELEHAIDRPVRTYSSGMTMRLGFAIAAFLDADVLLLDEVFAVGDEAFQRKCFGRIFAFKQAGGTIVFVSHDASAVERLCERSVLLEAGRVDPTPMLTDMVEFDQLPAAFEALRKPTTQCKVMLRPH